MKAETELLEAKAATSKFDYLEDNVERSEEAWKKLKIKEFSHRMETEEKILTNARKREAAKER